MGALNHQAVGEYLNQHFVSAFQKVGTFQKIAVGQHRGAVKVGGNVASYFCTPEGRVLHAIAGPVTGQDFLREARWANETYQFARMEERTPAQMQEFFRKAHLDRLKQQHGVTLDAQRLVTPTLVESAMLRQLVTRNGHIAPSNAAKVHLLLAAGAMPRMEMVYPVVFETVLNEQISNQPVVE